MHPLEFALQFRYLDKNEYETDGTMQRCQEVNQPIINDDAVDEPLKIDAFLLLPNKKGKLSLFAGQDIPTDKRLIEYTGIVRNGTISNHQSLPLINGFIVDAEKCGSLARFARYSCEPNCYLKTVLIDGDWKLFLYSARDVIKMEELTFSFPHEFGESDAKLVCSCGSRKCTGVIGKICREPKTVRHVCSVCGKVVTRKGNFLEHLNTHDKDRAVFKCKLCERFYVDKRGLNRHMRMNHSK